jgi:hypothetical protein
MRRTALLALVTLAALALPGCLIAYEQESDTWYSRGLVDSDCCEDCVRMAVLEQQISTMEQHLAGECAADCPYCTTSSDV